METRGTIALVGSPSSGKSTLFNRLTDSRKEITGKEFGITRDRNYGTGHWLDKEFTLIDTGGVTGENIPFQKEVQAQVELAIQEADVIFFVVDGRLGITNADSLVAKKLFPYKNKVFLVVNKIDDQTLVGGSYDFLSLGYSRLFAISAEHGLGIGDLLDEAIKLLPVKQTNPYEGALTFAFLGRPNVGKSSLANKMLGQERVIVSPLSGTTRDSVDISFTRGDQRYVMIDTAGVRRPGKVSEDLDKYALIRSQDACKRADIVLLVIDASEGLVSEDIHLTSYAQDYTKPVIIIVNKWDLHSHNDADQRNFTQLLRVEMKSLDYAPVLFVSALSGQNIQKIFVALDEINKTLHKKVPSSLLNSVILKAQMDNEAPDFNGGRLKISYCTQTDDVPPTFICFCNNPNYFHFSYQRYLENVIRESFGFTDVPIKFVIRGKRALMPGEE
ncbi:MAG: ribosome biogenesis GTPase Der [Bacilli bacterium]|jgi:GTP-binding protein|nr:ribosome biogenesis GTPase Der [Bacilli bacterium]